MGFNSPDGAAEGFLVITSFLPNRLPHVYLAYADK
jgi:hypothetical protein